MSCGHIEQMHAIIRSLAGHQHSLATAEQQLYKSRPIQELAKTTVQTHQYVIL